jgi:CheY-like chemotaxis protein
MMTPGLEGKRVLVIEDTAENMRLFRAVLKLEGVEVLEAPDAQTGIEIATRESPDLILMDIQMPEMDGLTATRLLRAEPKTAGIPIVAVTRFGDGKRPQQNARSRLRRPHSQAHRPLDFRSAISLVSAAESRLQVMNTSTHDQPSDSSSNDDFSGGRILVVDDVPANVRVLAGILKVAGYQTVTASSGPQCLEMLHSSAPDVVLLDVMMPDMDGFEVCRRIRSDAANSFLPVVMVTALHDTSDRIKAIEAGADDFLTKPVDDVEVVARVKSLVRVKRQREALSQAISTCSGSNQCATASP